MKVQEVMTTDVATTAPDVLLKDAAMELVRRRISGMPVVDEDRHVLGVLSETDILAKEGDERRGGGFLQWLVDPGDPVGRGAIRCGDRRRCDVGARTDDHGQTVRVVEAATIMLDEDVNRLPVVDEDGVLVGLVSRGDLVRAFARSDDEIQHEIEEDVIRKVMWLEPGGRRRDRHAGVVTLAGQVASKADAELLPTFARKVPGVVEVSSSLTYRDA